MVVRVQMVVMEKNKKDGDEDGRFVVVVMKFVEGGEVVAGMIVEVVAVEEGLDP